MNKILFWLHDNKANLNYHPMFCANKDVALRTLASEIRDIREKKAYSSYSILEDSDLFQIDLETGKIVKIDDYKVFFNGTVKVESGK